MFNNKNSAPMKNPIYFLFLLALIMSSCNGPKAEDSCGIWSIDYYVDSFGDITNTPYIKSTDIKGVYARNFRSEAIMCLMYSEDKSSNPEIGIVLSSSHDLVGAYMNSFTIKVSGEEFDPIVVNSKYIDDLGRFVIEGKNAKKIFHVLSSASSCEIKGHHEGFFSNTSFVFQVDSLAGLPSVYKKYKSLK